MFKKPTTVAQAIAPFKKAITDLTAVAEVNKGAMNAALDRISDAKRQAALVEKHQGAVADAASRESMMAERLAQKLLALIEDEDEEPTQSGSTTIVEADRPE